MGLGRRTREETVKWKQMTALRYQTVRRGKTIRYPWPPFEVRQKEGQSGRRGGAHLGKRVGVEALFRKCI